MIMKPIKKHEKISFKEKLTAEFKIFFANFRLEKTFLKICAYDFLFYILLFAIIMVFYKLIGTKYVEMQQLLSIAQQGPSQMQAYASQIKSLLYSAFFMLGVLFLALLAHYSFFKGLIWAEVYNVPLTQRIFWRFSIINLFLTVFIVLLIFLFSLFKTQYLVTVLLSLIIPFVTIYFFVIFHPLAIIKPTITVVFKKGFTFVFTKLHYYLLPLLLLGLVGIIINMFLNSLVFLKGIPSTIVYLIVYVCFFTFAKLYLSKILTLVEQ